MIRVLGILLGLSFVSLAHAEGTVGNGGDVVYCASGTPFSVRLLDHYEAQFFNPAWQLDLGAPELAVEQKVEMALNRLATKDAHRANLYRSYWSTFDADKKFTNDDLEDMPDSNHIAKPAGCEVRQIAIQFADDNLFQGRKYLINRPLWDALDNDGRAGLVLHELIYRDALRSGHLNSISTRKFNAMLSQSEFEAIDPAAYHQFITENRFSFVSSQPGVLLEPDFTVYASPGIPNVGRVAKGSFLNFGAGRISLSLPKYPERDGKAVALFYPGGQIEGVCYNPNLLHPYQMEYDGYAGGAPYLARPTLFQTEFQGAQRQITCVRFSQSGVVNYLRFASPQTIQVGAHTLQNVMEVSLDEQQKIKDLYIIGNEQILSEYRQSIHVSKRVRFFPNGKFQMGGRATMKIIVENEVVDVDAFEFFPGGDVKAALAKAPFMGRLANDKVVLLSGGDMAKWNAGFFEFNEEGKIVKGRVEDDAPGFTAASPVGDIQINDKFWLFDNGSLRLARTGSYQSGNDGWGGLPFTIHGQPVHCRIVGFHSNGEFSSCFYNLDVAQADNFPYYVNGQNMKVKGVTFHENGVIKFLDYAFFHQDSPDSRFKTEIQEQELLLWHSHFGEYSQFKLMGYFTSTALTEAEARVNSLPSLDYVGISADHEFYPNGKLRYGTIASSTGPLLRTDGSTLESNFGQGRDAAFDENGLVYFSWDDVRKF